MSSSARRNLKRPPRQSKRRKPAIIPGVIDVSRLVDVSHLTHHHRGKNKPSHAYVDRERGWCVQVYSQSTPGCKGTPWEGTLRIAIKHSSAKNPVDFEKREFGLPVTWDDMQAIKDHWWPDQIAVEVFPPRDKIVNVANMRWMWVLPIGSCLPFNLQGGNTLRLLSEPSEESTMADEEVCQ